MFVIYHIESTMQVGPTERGRPHSLYAKTYKTWHGALRTANKWNAEKRFNSYQDERAGAECYGPGEYGVAHVDHYRTSVVRMVERRNLISGKTYLEPSNTPGCCSPSTETYWSM